MMAGATVARWLTLGGASRYLGVDASTLRAWADAGRVRAFRTPGGHRRFTRDDLQALLHGGRALAAPAVARRLDRQGRSLARARSPAGERWYTALDGQTRARIRRTCGTLMHALTGYLGGGIRRQAHLRAGERAGRSLGRTLAARRLSPAQATRAFLHFRDLMTEAVTTRLALPPDQQVRSLRRIDVFLNRAMFQMMEVLQTPSTLRREAPAAPPARARESRRP